MKTNEIISLTDEQAKIISQEWKPMTFEKDFSLYYQGQIPNGGFLLSEGEIFLKTKRNKVTKVSSPALIGIAQLLKNTPCKATAKIISNSRASFIDKTSISEKLNSKDKISDVLRAILEK